MVGKRYALVIGATVVVLIAVIMLAVVPKLLRESTGPKTFSAGVSGKPKSRVTQGSGVDFTPSSLARTKDIAGRIKASRTFGEDSLGIEFRVNGYQTLTLSVDNNSDADVRIGSDIQGTGSDGGFLIWHTPRSDRDLRRRMYAMDARQLSAVKDGKPTMWITGCNGQGLGLDQSVTDKYTGSWLEHVRPGAKAVIRQRLVYPLDRPKSL